MMKMVVGGLAVGLLVLPVGAHSQDASQDPWALVRPLEGVWEGEGEGFGQTSTVTHTWEFVLDGKFLRLQTRSVAMAPDGNREVHEDVGYVSWSEGEGRLRFRQFLSEGFVNTFLLRPADAPESGIDFEPEGTEGMDNFSVGMTLRFEGDHEYHMALAMGAKGSALKVCQTMRMRKQ